MGNHAKHIQDTDGLGLPIVGRGRNWIAFDNLDGKTKRVYTIDPLHLRSDLNTEIDATFVPDTGAWQWRLAAADFQVHTRNIFNSGNLIEWRHQSGQWIIVDPQSINWINQDLSREQIAIKQPIAATVNDNKISFSNGYGTGRHFEYIAHPKRLIKHIIIDSFSNLPTPSIPGTIYFEAEWSMTFSGGVDLWLDGVKWTKENGVRVRTANSIEFRNTANTEVLWYADAPIAIDANGNHVICEYEVRRQGGPASLFITVRVPKTWIDTAVFPITIDPTFTDGYGGDATTYKDTFLNRDNDSNPNVNYGIRDAQNFVYKGSGYEKCMLLEFDLSSLVGVTVNSATLSLFETIGKGTDGDNIMTVHRILSANSGWVEGTKWEESESGSPCWAYYAYNTVRWAGDTGSDGGADAGCSVSGTDYAATDLGTLDISGSNSAGSEYAVSLTAAQVEIWIDNNYGCRVDRLGGWLEPNVASSDHTTTSYRPKLVIVYTESGDLIAEDITTEPAVLGSPLLSSGGSHELTASDITTLPAILGQPKAMSGLILGGTIGFVLEIPVVDPGGSNVIIDGSSIVTKDISPSNVIKIIEIGWWRDSGTNGANFEVGLYDESGGVANALLQVDNTNSSTSTGWIRVTGLSWTINPNTSYWLAVQMDAHSGSSYVVQGTSGGRGIDRLTSQTTLTNPYGGGALIDNDGCYGVYALIQVTFALTSADITTAPAVLDAPTLSIPGDSLTSEDITTEPAVLEQPTISQTHVITSEEILTLPAVLDQPSIGQTHVITSEDITTEASVLDQPTLHEISALTSEDIITEPAIVDQSTIGQTHAITSEDITTEPAIVDQTTISQTHVITSEDITTEPAVLEQPTISVIHSLSSEDITTESAVLDQSNISQTHVLSSEEILTEPGIVDQSNISQIHVLSSEEILTEPAVLEQPSLSTIYVLFSEDITTEPAIVDQPVISQVQILSSEDITTEPAIVDQSIVGQTHVLGSEDITTEPAILGQPTFHEIHALSSEDITTEPAVLEQPVISQTHVITSEDITTEPAVLGAPTIVQTLPDELTAEDITTEPAIFTQPSISQTHIIISEEILTEAALIGQPIIGQLYSLFSEDIATEPAIFDTPSIGQIHSLSSEDITTESAVFGQPTLSVLFSLFSEDITTEPGILGQPDISQIHILVGNGITTSNPEISPAVISQYHYLVGEDILSNPAVIDTPIFWSRLPTPTPMDRIYLIFKEDRTLNIYQEDRTYLIEPEDRIIKIKRNI